MTFYKVVPLNPALAGCEDFFLQPYGTHWRLDKTEQGLHYLTALWKSVDEGLTSEKHFIIPTGAVMLVLESC